jgi:4-diphosphocytidyl-2-C-methyl-D-erythritol kinase
VTLHALAPGKINLALFLGATRADGRHRLVTLFESVSLADELTLAELAQDAGADQVLCPGVDGENLVAAALRGLRERGWEAPPVRVEIVKRIPVAAGMGGGSADAAAALRLASALSPGRPQEVAALAAELGADVPSQLAPGLVVGTGAGEVVEPFEPLAEHAVVIVPLPHALSTAAVYGEADRLGLGRGDAELDSAYARLLKALRPGARLDTELIVNDLAPAALSLCPPIADALDALRASGAEQALVCGSGPTAAGLFWGTDAQERAAAAARALNGPFPGATATHPVTVEFGLPRFAQ